MRANTFLRPVVLSVLLLRVPVVPAMAQQSLQREGPPVTREGARPVRLVAAGDINLAASVGRVMAVRGMRYPFASTRPLLRAADIAFGNLECCVAQGGAPLPDKQFTFRAHPRTARALADAGFDIVSLANNHAWDYGREALAETIRHVRAAGVAVVGAGDNSVRAHALKVLQRNGLRVGFLAYLGMFPPLLPESAELPSVAMASIACITREVRAASRQVDFLIVSLHAGKELAKRPTARQRALATAAIDAGADIVLGHHPHVVQPMEVYRDRIICYSLGNFVFSAGGRGSGALLDATLYPDGAIRARLRPLILAGVQPRLADPASARIMRPVISVDRRQR